MPFTAVTWTDLVNIVLVGNDITKGSSPVADGWNAGGASLEYIPSAVAGQGISFKMSARWSECGGISSYPSPADRNSIQFGISLWAYGGPGDAWCMAIENGTYVGSYVQFTSDTVFTIIINASGDIEYRADNSLFYTSLQTPSYPLYADASLYDTSAYGERSRISDMEINAPTPPVAEAAQHLLLLGVG